MLLRSSVLWLVLAAAIVPASSQDLSLDSLLRAHSYGMSISDGKLSGPGNELILEAARDAQFVAIAEEHNVAELNDLARGLFKELHDRLGFRYVALEQGSVIASWFGDAERRGNIDRITDLVHRYPHAPTFATDEELQMIASVGAMSSATTNPIWGVDQELGVLHIIERLMELAPDDAMIGKLEMLAGEAREYELDRFGEIHYVAQVLTPDQLSDIPSLFGPRPQGEAAMLIDALQRTNRIYTNYALSQKGRPTGYESNREREESMKLRFMEHYRRAQASGDSTPRVLAKLGHWHIFRGIYRSNVSTFGNFLSEFSLSNGMSTFILSTSIIESPEGWRNSTGMIAEAATSSPFSVIDLRTLRPFAHQNMIKDLSDAWKRLIFQADAALLVRGGMTGSYDITKGKRTE